MEKLIALNNGGVQITIYSPRWHGDRKWEVQLKKESEGVSLDILARALELDEAIYEAYSKWLRVTGQGEPSLTLRQIEHVPALGGDDEDPS